MTRLQSGRLSFSIKPAIAIACTAAADALFYGGHVGSAAGVFALSLVGAVVAVQPGVRADPRARIAVALAAVMAAILLDAPSLQAGLLCWIALTLAVLSPRAAAGLGAAAWTRRLGYQALAGAFGPAVDGLRLRGRLGLPRGAVSRFLAIIAIPTGGGALFLALFASANPIIDQALAGMRLPDFDALRTLFWLVCLAGVWSFLRPRFRRGRPAPPARVGVRPIPGISVASVGLSLAVFNALFAVQNGLDVAFLWSGGALPKGMTLAEYAHRGAYPLIVTALLAGVFVLVALRPGSATARQPWLRALVVLWVAQNVFLVASSILRTLTYIEAYSLTRLRIAALLWMGLVAAGLVFIGWRLLRGKSSGWLVNANLLAVGLVLAGCGVVDIGGVAARWNVDRAREVGGGGPPLDLRYLSGLDAASIAVPLSDLARRPLPPDFRNRVSCLRAAAMRELGAREADWRDWTWRGARRLARARALFPDPPATPAIAQACDARTERTAAGIGPSSPPPLTAGPPG